MGVLKLVGRGKEFCGPLSIQRAFRVMVVLRSPIHANEDYDLYSIVKGTDHNFCWSGKYIYHLQKQENIHIFQNK